MNRNLEIRIAREVVLCTAVSVFVCFLWLGPCLCPSLAQQPLSYEVKIRGVEDGKLKSLLEEVSNTVQMKDQPPASLDLLEVRMKQDLPRLKEVLSSQGLYGGEVSGELDRTSAPVKVIFKVNTGPAYHLESVTVNLSEEERKTQLKLPGPSDIGLPLGMVALSKPIVDASMKIARTLQNQGYAFAQVTDRKVWVDHMTRSVRVAYTVRPGPEVEFGDTRVTGLETVSEDYVLRRLPWKTGDRFSADLMNEAQKRIVETGLFGLVRVSHGASLDDKGRLPMAIEVKERKPRTVKAGVSYNSDVGPGGKASWENRNLLGNAERLNFSVEATTISLQGNAGFRRPDFLRTDQALVLSAVLKTEEPDAYRSKSFDVACQVERLFSNQLNGAMGIGVRISKVEQFGEDQQTGLLYLPSRLEWKTTDRPLDPARGGWLTLDLAPYQDVSEQDLRFFKAYGRYSRYVLLLDPNVLLALKGVVGSIGGATRDDVPADLRFYAGGGGSIRGYPYQKVGPLEKHDPKGGRSLVEVSAEVRFKVTEKIGIVAFLDGGNAFSSSFPDPGEKLLWGAGGGIRYFTPVGPLRLDVGVPLERRKEIDDPFQVYISLGQAF
jgi:translocation and assembly module TamA